ncbi:hypothetical protein [Acinetobacter bereziniae]|uniref:hypothetical protein n=1 Tax=Acinetobacter bereziniae TaxID=106648 RepID=UPI002954E40E|nr:hypothetical protein [Acinetobacter bereziniae]MDV8155222.1 hypothetical protein [Acinetobacter bereziniae]
MTTNNNDQSLIEKVGGIERAIALEAMLQKHAVPESWKISIINGMWHRSSVGFTHSDLRTAIAKHDTTDHVTTQLCIGCGSPDLHKGGEIKEPKMCLDCFAEMVGFTRTSNGFVESDEVTDIRNHLSPSTIVKDLEAERHG